MNLIAIDTETVRGEPWSIQYCTFPKVARMLLVENNQLKKLKTTLEASSTLVVLHNALFDLSVLASVGIHPSSFADTMFMAYLLGENSIGLKTLSYRHCSMELQPYREVIASSSQDKALEYLSKVSAREWVDPQPILEIRPNGEEHVRFPQNIRSKVLRLLKRFEADAELDLREKWEQMDGRGEVKAEFGEMEPGYLSDIPLDDATQYACMDADATFRLYPILWLLLQESGQEGVFWRDMRAIPMVIDMMQAGIKIDKEHFYRLGEEYEEKARELLELIEGLNGGYLNPGSPPQVLAALKDRGLNVGNTDARTLDAHRGDELVRLIQDYRGYCKLNSTYISVLPEYADEGGRVHTSFSITRTATGRLASSNPNLQNQPVRSEDGRRIREGFVAQKGAYLVAFDYSQIELRMAAHLSQDPVMMEIYRNDGDIHMETACGMFGLKEEEIDSKKHRRPAKTVNFGTIYGITAPTLLAKFYHEDIWDFTEADCVTFIRAWEEKYSGYFDWTDEIRAVARRNGFVVDMFGRRRYVPEVYSSHFWIRERGLREAVNAPIQMGAQGIIKEAMGRLVPIYRAWQQLDYVVRPLLQIHDELLWEIEDCILDAVIPMLKDTMENVVELSTPTPVDVKVGLNWNQMKEWKGESE